MFKYSGNPNGTRIAILALLILFIAFASCEETKAFEVSSQVTHLSSAGTTNFNRGNNAIMVCGEIDAGLGLCAGRHFVASKTCGYALTLSQRFARVWKAYLFTHGDLDCTYHDAPFNQAANAGAFIARVADWKRYRIEFGAGIKEHGDLVIGSSSKDEGLQFSFMINVGIRAWRGSL